MSQETETETKNDSSKPIVTPNYFTTLRDNYFLVNRPIWLTGEISTENSCEILKYLNFWNDESKSPVKIFICSPGGEVDIGFALIDEIEKLKAAKIPVITVCCGACSSMASIILAAGTKGKRYTYPHGRIMIHRPSYPDGIDDGTIDGLDIMKNELSVTSDIMCEMLMKYTGKSKKIIKEAISSDNFMSAAEAKKFGIVDKLDTFIA